MEAAAAAAEAGTKGSTPGEDSEGRVQPIDVLYKHLHRAIRSELAALSRKRSQAHACPEQERKAFVALLKERCKFLFLVYRYHCSLQDEVIYPVLDGKVRNVVFGYTKEHEAEDLMLRDLIEHIDRMESVVENSPADGKTWVECASELVRKAAKVDAMQLLHMEKEEQQIYPLLIANFDANQQADLVCQFFFTIHMSETKEVLNWLLKFIPPEETVYLSSLLEEIVGSEEYVAIRDLYLDWSPGGHQPSTSTKEVKCCREVLLSSTDAERNQSTEALLKGKPFGEKPPLVILQHYYRFWNKISSLLAQSAASHPNGAPFQVEQYVKEIDEHFRLLRSLKFYSVETVNEVISQVSAKIASEADRQKLVSFTESGSNKEQHCFDAVCESLGIAKSMIKRKVRATELDGALQELQQNVKNLDALIQEKCSTADNIILTNLMKHLTPLQQCVFLWQFHKAFPLRTLKTLVPKALQHLSREEHMSYLNNLCTGAKEEKESKIVIPVMKLLLTELSQMQSTSKLAKRKNIAEDVLDAKQMDSKEDSYKKKKPKRANTKNPIDTIFNFHVALRRELKDFTEESTKAVQLCMHFEDNNCTHVVLSQQLKILDGKFKFLKGMYSAHSKAEDEIVFPTLEAKEALHNVSQFYTMDHEKETKLITLLTNSLDKLMHAVNGSADDKHTKGSLVEVAEAVTQGCAAFEAAVDTHLVSEEQGLWHLFGEHFSIEEQEQIIGRIIGRTGAEVLKDMLPWVKAALQTEEGEDMMSSIQAATRNTMFQDWLSAISGADKAAMEDGGEEGSKGQEQSGSVSDSHSMSAEIIDLLPYLPSDQKPSIYDGRFEPGWNDIFRISQNELQAAVKKVSIDTTLEPKRKAYLMQHIMALRWIVSQQKSALHKTVTTDTTSNKAKVNADADAGKNAGAGQHSTFFKSFHHGSVLGCKHYQRNCALIPSCCGKPYVCRLCHDEAEDHVMDRYEGVKEVLCMLCGERQAPSDKCSKCGEKFAAYFCNVCHLYDNDKSHDIYHCPFCNVCRRGKGLGIDVFHCMKCNYCMSLDLQSSHVCREKALETNCPICHDDLFTSNRPVKALRCDHFMHSSCFAEYTKTNYTCPLCSKSLGDMRAYFQMLDALLEVESGCMPREFADKTSSILCNDCGGSSEVPFHFVYHKCTHCKSYNTRLV